MTPTRLEGVLIGVPPRYVPQNAEDIFDEFECLNLNITTPVKARDGNDFPVLVYFHGGGGFSGSNSDWWCDPSGIVSKSVTMEKPVVVVTIKLVFLRYEVLVSNSRKLSIVCPGASRIE